MKKSLAFLLAICLCLLWGCAFSEEAVAEETVATPISAGEIAEQLSYFQVKALSSDPVSVTPDTESTETAYIFAFEEGYAVYADTEALTEDSNIFAVEVLSSDLPTVRGAKVDMFTEDLLHLFKSDNDGLSGSYYSALVYTEGDSEKGFNCCTVSRSGQRVVNIMYAIAEPVEDQFFFSSMSCYMDGGTVSAILLHRNMISAEETAMIYDALHVSAEDDSYWAVPVNYNDGTMLEPFEEADLSFSGIDFLTTVSADLNGVLEEQWQEDGKDAMMHRVDGDGWYVIFNADKNQQNEKISLVCIMSDEVEGPRFVKIGDSITDAICRFRYEETEFDYETMSQLLYGSTEGIPCGVAEYFEDGSATLRYTLCTEDGENVLLLLTYKDMHLTEILVSRI